MAPSKSKIAGTDRGEKKNDYLLALMTYRKLSKPVTIFLANNTSITPNQVSFFGIILAIAAGIFFSFGDWESLVIGYALLQLTIFTDFVDGNLARYSNKADTYGKWVDEFANKIHKFFWLLGVSIGLYNATNNPFYLALGAAAQFTWFFAVYIMETKANHFQASASQEMFRGSSRLPMNLIMNNLFGFFILINLAAISLWLIVAFGLMPLKHICSTWKKMKS
jgi:phosphatidylglycerophosphate synthase